jgi:hypothetical protein
MARSVVVFATRNKKKIIVICGEEKEGLPKVNKKKPDVEGARIFIFYFFLFNFNFMADEGPGIIGVYLYGGREEKKVRDNEKYKRK